MSPIFDECSELANFQLPEGEIVVLSGRQYYWISLDEDGCIYVPREILGKYGIKLGDRLLLVRGRRFGLAFCVKGLLISEATKHSELPVFS